MSGGAVLGLGVALGVGSAVAWGVGDFAGGLAAKRIGGMVVAGGSQLTGFAILLVLVVALHPAPPTMATLLLGTAGGICGGLGLAALYRALAIGNMGIVSAVAGVGSAAIPLAVGVTLQGNTLGPLQLAGIGCALLAVAAASGATSQGLGRISLLLAGLAAIGFGLWFVLLDLAAEHDQLWALIASRGTAAVLIGGVTLPRAGRVALRASARLIAAAGIADVSASGLVVLAFASIPVGVAAAVAGLYPLVTMLMARVFLGEALPRLGMAAIAIAVVGIVLISIGG
jgi:drug/metabolite transporter (DMT)-like permease